MVPTLLESAPAALDPRADANVSAKAVPAVFMPDQLAELAAVGRLDPRRPAPQVDAGMIHVGDDGHTPCGWVPDEGPDEPDEPEATGARR